MPPDASLAALPHVMCQAWRSPLTVGGVPSLCITVPGTLWQRCCCTALTAYELFLRETKKRRVVGGASSRNESGKRALSFPPRTS